MHKMGFSELLWFATVLCSVSVDATTAKETCTYSGVPCVFPFTYANKHYNSCIPGSRGPWCGIKSEILENTQSVDWAYCKACPELQVTECTVDGYQCAWPYIDENGLRHTTCLYHNGWFNDYYWCPIIHGYKAGGTERGKCADVCPNVTKIYTTTTPMYTIEPTEVPTHNPTTKEILQTKSNQPSSNESKTYFTFPFSAEVTPNPKLFTTLAPTGWTHAKTFKSEVIKDTQQTIIFKINTSTPFLSPTTYKLLNTVDDNITAKPTTAVTSNEVKTNQDVNSSKDIPTNEGLTSTTTNRVSSLTVASPINTATISHTSQSLTRHMTKSSANPSSSVAAPRSNQSMMWIIVGMSAGVGLLIATTFAACCCYRRHMQMQSYQDEENQTNDALNEPAIPLMSKNTPDMESKPPTIHERSKEEGSQDSAPDSGVDEITQES